MKFNINNRRYVGNKYKLMEWIKALLQEHCKGDTFFDVFAGTGSVTDFLLENYHTFIINDLLYSNHVIYKAFFGEGIYDERKLDAIANSYNMLDKSKLEDNYISIHFGSKYYTKEDAKLIGYIREDIETLKKEAKVNEKEYHILLSSLLYSSDKIANTCGHYDAYRKIKTINADMKFLLIQPRDTSHKKFYIHRTDSNRLARELSTDIAFIDPPYNSRQYSRFYHVLENITQWKKPELFGVALKPPGENMSNYCRVAAPKVFDDLIQNLDTKYIVVTYNNTYNSKSSSSQNKISLEEIEKSLKNRGSTTIFEKPYKFFNAGKTDLDDHKEYVFITEVEAR